MAKINIPKGFDKSQFEGDVLKKIEPFVDYVNQNFDQLTRALDKQITASDNIAGSVLSLTAKHNTAINVPNPGKAVTEIRPLLCVGAAIRSNAYTFKNDGSISVTFRFDGAIPIQTKNCVSARDFIAVYQCQDPVQAGDTVSITGFGQTFLNGEFLVIGVTSSSPRSIYCYNLNNGVPVSPTAAATETKSNYSGTQEQSKSVTLFLGF